MNNRFKGILCIILAACFFALMSTMVRLSGDVPTMEKAFFRNIVAVFFACFILRRRHVSLKQLRRADWIPLLLRAAFGTVGLFCNFYAIDRLNLSDANMLNKMSPFFAILASFLLLGETLTVFQGVAVAIAFGGSLFIIKPTPASLSLGPSLVGLLGGFGAGVAYTIVRYMGRRHIDSALIIFVFSAFSCLVCVPLMLLHWVPLSWVQLGFLFLAGCCGCAGQFAITAAYTYAPARDLSVYDYSQVIFSALLGWLFFGQVPDGWSVVGYVIICGTAATMFWYNRRRDRLAKQA